VVAIDQTEQVVHDPTEFAGDLPPNQQRQLPSAVIPGRAENGKRPAEAGL
jgi:hypothetical protein